MAACITRTGPDLTEWTWLHDPAIPQHRPTLCLQAQQVRSITAEERSHLLLDCNFTLADVLYRIHHNWQEPQEADGPSPLHFDLAGFKHTNNQALWRGLLQDFLPQWEPSVYLSRRIPSAAPPKGKATKAWTQCVRALTNLLGQNEHINSSGEYVPDPLYDKLTMLVQCLPILLLRAVPFTSNAARTKLICRKCELFLSGSWRLLTTEAARELAACPASTSARLPGQPPTNQASQRHQTVLQKTRLLQYSRAMNLLRSPGLATDAPDEIHSQLQALHPAEDSSALFHDSPPGRPVSAATFNFISGPWLATQIKKSASGTAVDQWGWDSREMWLPFLQDEVLMEDLARCWPGFRPVAAGYLPAAYRQHLAGGRLIALSKHPKPGVRPICISDARRRLVAKGLATYANAHFAHYFQHASSNVIQFGANTKNGASHMFHLIQAQLHAAALGESGDDPIVATALDSENAFNAHTRAHLVEVLNHGCEQYASLDSDHEHNLPVGWDILYGHLRAHYGTNGLLKYYSGTDVFTIHSQSGVQQGDPLGSLLFALGVHPLLVRIGANHPSVFLSAYADNIIITGPLSKVQAAVTEYQDTMLRAGLTLNPSDSAVYVPSWTNLSLAELQSRPSVLTLPDGSPCVQTNSVTTFPLHVQGIKVLGCPIGTEAFRHKLIDSIISKVSSDLDCLRQFPHLHQRVKLAIYCCNTRIHYLLRAVPFTQDDQRLRQYDSMFDSFMAQSLAFEENYATGPYSLAYTQALQQCRLGIKQGGMGLTSAAMVAPAALHVALREIIIWFGHYAARWNQRALHHQPWLSAATASQIPSQTYFPYFRHHFDATVAVLFQQWSITISETDDMPQNAITQVMKSKSLQLFRSALPEDSLYRLDQVSQTCCPARSSTSDIRPALSHDSDSLRQCPMGHFSLTCPFELTNAAFHTSSALLFGYPVPHARYLRSLHGASPLDPWGDALLNSSTHAANTRHASHDAITSMIANLASSHGVSTSARLQHVPLAAQDTMQRGDLVAMTSGILSARSHTAVPAKLVLDFVLGHTYTTAHRPKRDMLTALEDLKRRHYTQLYHEQGLAFAPLAANSFGQLGPEFLRFLWALSDHAARSCIPVPLPVLPLLSAVAPPDAQDTPAVLRYKRLRSQIFVQSRLHVLTAVYEAVTHRVYGKTFPLQNDPQYWDALSSLSAFCSGPHLPTAASNAPRASQLSSASQPSSVLMSYASAVAALPRQPLPPVLFTQGHPCSPY